MTHRLIILFSLVVLSFGLNPGFAADKQNKSVDISGDQIWSGFVDKNGTFVIPLKARICGDFSDGLAWCPKSHPGANCTYDVIDTRGNTVFSCLCDWKESDFHEGLAVVQRHEGYVYVNRNGDVAIPGPFQNAWPICKGKARVVLNDGSGRLVEIDRNGKIVANLPAGQPNEDFEASAIFIEDGSPHPLCKLEEIHTSHGRRTRFSEGLACVGFQDRQNKWRLAYIDRSLHRQILLNKDIAEAGDFHEGLAPVLVRNGSVSDDEPYQNLSNRLGFINTKGKLVISPKYYCERLNEMRFSEGVAALSRDGFTRYVDKRGREIFSFLRGNDFHDGLAQVSMPVTSHGEVIRLDDLSHGYQSQAACRAVLRAFVEHAVSQLYSPKPVEFLVNVNSRPPITSNITLHNGDAVFESNLLTALNALDLPAFGVAIRDFGSIVETFRLENGKILPCAQPLRRRAMTVPTLPEGAPIPDNE